MLPKINRLKSAKEIGMVFRAGKWRRGDFLSLKSQNNFRETKLAFVVGRAAAKRASHRNKIKRRLREAAKELLPEIKIGFNIVVAAQEGIVGKNFQEIKKTLRQILKNSNLLKL